VILAVCLNPAIDVTYLTTAVRAAASHSVVLVSERAGGKGINVARVLHQVGEPVTVTGLLGGSRGEAIEKELAAEGISTSFTSIVAESRRSIAVLDNLDATVFNERGPEVSASEWSTFCEHFRLMASDARVVTLSGSVPTDLGETAYATLVALAGEVPVVLDASGMQLNRAVAERPALAAPNRSEAAEALGREIRGVDQLAAAAAADLRARGAGAAVISSGAEGLVAVTDKSSWAARPPRLVSGNPTGAGDALTAALARGLLYDESWPETLATGIAWSAGAVAMPWAGQLDEQVVSEIRSQVVVEAL
jgi:tagatose 6-phosphate kinase